ncbi:MAG TPA: D-sedoheptulose 7-phosphate isomerase [Bacteroidales bacterium]|nr:D-sedoheptulose 7-phosphate isomerase [Bacteroidales bacterium]HPT21479.1 D-sedoheptulose 7-phosphate isomerase [Bacteroidales bacterium]
MRFNIEKQITDSISVKQKLLESPDILLGIESAASSIIAAMRNNRKVLVAGNGGSAADAQHIAGEFVSRFYFDRPGLPCVALTTDTSILTAIGNDYGYEKIFTRQIEALGNEGDIFIGISTSGNSLNLIEALKKCREKKLLSIVLTGSAGGKMKEISDICIMVPSDETPRIQESHILMGHIICCLVEEEIFGHLKPCRR